MSEQEKLRLNARKAHVRRQMQDGLLRNLAARGTPLVDPMTDRVDDAIKTHLSRRSPFKFPENY